MVSAPVKTVRTDTGRHGVDRDLVRAAAEVVGGSAAILRVDGGRFHPVAAVGHLADALLSPVELPELAAAFQSGTPCVQGGRELLAPAVELPSNDALAAFPIGAAGATTDVLLVCTPYAPLRSEQVRALARLRSMVRGGTSAAAPGGSGHDGTRALHATTASFAADGGQAATEAHDLPGRLLLPEEVSLHDLLWRLADRVPDVTASHLLTWRSQPDLRVVADVELLCRVLALLVEVTARYTAEGSRIEVLAECPRSADQGHMAYAVVTVQGPDDGSVSASLARGGEPAAALLLADLAMQLQDGALHVETPPGGDTHFQAWLPLADQP